MANKPNTGTAGNSVLNCFIFAELDMKSNTCQMEVLEHCVDDEVLLILKMPNFTE